MSRLHFWNSQSDFSRVYSNCCCSCSFEPEIIKIGHSSHKMYINNIVNFQESTTILNACTKKSGNLLNAPHLLINPLKERCVYKNKWPLCHVPPRIYWCPPVLILFRLLYLFFHYFSWHLTECKILYLTDKFLRFPHLFGLCTKKNYLLQNQTQYTKFRHKILPIFRHLAFVVDSHKLC